VRQLGWPQLLRPRDEPVIAAAIRPGTACPGRAVITQPATPAAAPVLAERTTVATASASAHTAAAGISQPNVTAAPAYGAGNGAAFSWQTVPAGGRAPVCR
jgi:hypothetical protein